MTFGLDLPMLAFIYVLFSSMDFNRSISHITLLVSLRMLFPIYNIIPFCNLDVHASHDVLFQHDGVQAIQSGNLSQLVFVWPSVLRLVHARFLSVGQAVSQAQRL